MTEQLHSAPELRSHLQRFRVLLERQFVQGSVNLTSIKFCANTDHLKIEDKMTSPATASATTSAFSMYMTQNPTTIAILESLQGWLNKKKNPEEYKNKIFRYSGSEYNKRWFKIIEMKGFDEIELAIAYCGSQYDKEPKGWIYLKDVRMITDDTEIFTLLSPQRKLVLEAPTKAEHKLWLQGLVDLCHNADLTGINSLITLPSKTKSSMPRPWLQHHQPQRRQLTRDRSTVHF